MIESSVPEKPVVELSPIAIQKAIMEIAGLVKDVKELQSGHILVECAKKAHADKLLRASMLTGVTIKASHHHMLNSSEGLIHARDLDDCDEHKNRTGT